MHGKWPTPSSRRSRSPCATDCSLGSAPPTPSSNWSYCLVNGFDPRWGTPPDNYWGLPLQFDTTNGVYIYDHAYALKNGRVAGRIDVLTYTNATEGEVNLGYLAGMRLQ